MDDFQQSESFESVFTGDGGFEFQKELLLHCSLALRKMNCENFSFGYEVKKYPKFDDVVCAFELNSKRYLIVNQAKFFLKETTVNRAKLLEGDTGFTLKQYLPEILRIKEKTPPDQELFFIITTTAKMDTYNLPMDSVKSEVIRKLFGAMIHSGVKVLQFNVKFKNEIQEILQSLKIPDLEESSNYIIERLIFIAETLKIDELLALNNDLAMKDFIVSNRESFCDAIRRKTYDFIKFNMKTKARKALKKLNFEKMLQNSALDVDLPGISESFLREFPSFVEFDDQILIQMMKDLENGLNFIKSDNSVRLDAFRVYSALKKEDKDTLLIPFSKLSDSQLTYLETYEKNVVFVIEEENQTQSFLEKSNIFYVANSPFTSKARCLMPFSFDHLTLEAQQQVLDSNISIENLAVTPTMAIEDENYISENYKALLRNLIKFSVKKGKVELERIHKQSKQIRISKHDIKAANKKCRKFLRKI